MELLNGKIKPIYFKYLSASFGTALIASVYSIVDVAMVGQYQGPEGTAALAVVAPLWNIIYSLGLLVGIGGSVLFSARRGGGRGDGSENQYFTAAAIGAVILAALAWAGIWCFEGPILTFFGADESLLALAQRYMQPIKPVFPLFLLNQLLAGFLRNDGNPGLATMSVLAGGIFNVFGDYFFVFPCDMGVYGAGLATAIGSGISFLVMLIHFVSRKNTLRLVRPERLGEKLRAISVTGFSTFFVDVAMGILTVLFNRQIMRWLGSDAMAVYGPIIQISTFAQCCAYSVGQASQPIISMNYGATQPALQGLNFHLPVGSMTYLVGHSGAGKSTLLKLIMGMEKANAGNIWFNGHDITRLSKYEIPFLRRQIGMVHQDYRLLTDRSVAENVALPLIIAGMNPKEAHTRALVALDRVGLRSKANYMPPQISGGDQQPG